MAKIVLILRTLRYLKPIQIWNRIWRKRLSLFPARAPGGEIAPLPEFTFLNMTARPEGWNDRRMPKLWLYNLHYFDYLDRGRWRKEVEVDSGIDPSSLVSRWIDENPVGWGNGWEPYPISLRVVNWIKWMMASEEKLRVEVEERIRRSIVQQVRWLEKRLEYHLLANHLLANAKALVFAGVYLKEKRWYEKGMAIYRKELPEQVLDDGVHFELSAMYHSIILEDLLDCYNLTGDALFKRYAEKMLAGLAFLTGPDGKIVKFNDAADGIARSPEELVAYAGEMGLGMRSRSRDAVSHRVYGEDGAGARTSGFVRQEAGAYVMMAKCGEIGPSYQPGHAHADTFSFELWRDGVKIVADTGTDRYVVDGERRRQRGTAAHNTVLIDGRDSSEVWAGHRVGRRFDPRTHRREFKLSAEGLWGRDLVSGKGRHAVELRFHVPAGVSLGAEVRAPGLTFERTEEAAPLCVEFGRQEMGRCLCYRTEATLPVEVEWRIW